MKKLTANFYPAAEPKNGYIGSANITIGNAIDIYGISVFLSAENLTLNIDFPGFGDNASYVVPKSKEAYAALRDVVAMAVDSETHFGYRTGEYGVNMVASGKMVQEPKIKDRFRKLHAKSFCKPTLFLWGLALLGI